LTYRSKRVKLDILLGKLGNTGKESALVCDQVADVSYGLSHPGKQKAARSKPVSGSRGAL